MRATAVARATPSTTTTARARSTATRARRARRATTRAGVEEETNFARIDATSSDAPGGVAERRFGPECTLLVGFTKREVARWRETLDAIGADFVRATACERAMLDAPLGRALERAQADASAVTPAFGVPRMMFLSGMSSAEVMEIVDVYDELEWAPCVFACAVPKNYETNVRALLAEIMDDHERLTGSQAQCDL